MAQRGCHPWLFLTTPKRVGRLCSLGDSGQPSKPGNTLGTAHQEQGAEQMIDPSQRLYLVFDTLLWVCVTLLLLWRHAQIKPYLKLEVKCFWLASKHSKREVGLSKVPNLAESRNHTSLLNQLLQGCGLRIFIIAKFRQVSLTHVQICNQSIDPVVDICLSWLLQNFF